jgi:O-antigen/teichoic acid export membrane protein
VLTRLLIPSEYGIISVFNSYVSLLSVVLTLNVHASVSRYFYEEKDDFTIFLGTSTFLTLSIIIPASIVFYLLSNRLKGLFNLPSLVTVLMIPMVVVTVIDEFFNQVYQPLRESKRIAIVNMAKTYIGFGLSVIIIVLLKGELYLGPIFGSIIIGVFFSGYFIFKMKPYFKPAFKWTHIKYILHYSLPLIPYTLSGYILAQFDRIMINSYNGSGDAGLYSLAYNIGMLLSVVIGSMNAAWMPKYFEYMNRKQYREHDRDVDRLFRFSMIVAVFLILFGKEVGFLLAKSDYYAALHVIPIVVIGYVFFGIFTIYSRNIGYAKKTIYSSIILLTSGFTNVFLNALFIPKYGYIAAAYTTLVSYFLMAILAWIVSKLVLKMHSVPLKIILIPILMIVPFIAGYYVIEAMQPALYINILIKACMLFVASFVLIFKYIKTIGKYLKK